MVQQQKEEKTVKGDEGGGKFMAERIGKKTTTSTAKSTKI